MGVGHTPACRERLERALGDEWDAQRRGRVAGLYITYDALQRHGYTESCRKCVLMRQGEVTHRGHHGHTQTYRERMKRALGDEGDARAARAQERLAEQQRQRGAADPAGAGGNPGAEDTRDDVPRQERAHEAIAAATQRAGPESESDSDSDRTLVAAGGNGRRTMPLMQGDLTAAVARGYMPAVADTSLQKDTGCDYRWRAYYPRLGHSHVFQAFSVSSDRDAMLYCIRTVWEWHTAATGEECPWILE